jgi:hypothetical protein
MSSWTKRQIEILMDWVEENNEYSEKSIWAKRYYDLLYLIIYIPSIIITAYLSSTPNANYIAPVIINQAITTLDKFFNFGKLASEYEGYSNLYQNFSDRILEELVKPESVKQNGSVFYHDMNWEKQRLGDKTKPIPWIVEKIYNNYKYKKRTIELVSESDNGSTETSESSHGIIYNDESQMHTPRNNVATIMEKSQSGKIYTKRHNDAALVIQNAWYNWCVAKNKTHLIMTIHKRKIMPKLVKNIITDRREYEQNKTKKLQRSQSIAIPGTSSCNLMLPNPQTKMQRKLAKMIHESIPEDPASNMHPLANQLDRFNNNFDDTPKYEDFLEIIIADKNRK